MVLYWLLGPRVQEFVVKGVGLWVSGLVLAVINGMVLAASVS